KVGIGLGVGFGALAVLVVLIVILVNALSRPGTSGPGGGGPVNVNKQGGATTGPKNWSHDFGTNQKMSYTVQFRGGGLAQVWIDGAPADNTNVTLHVYDNVT